MMNLRYGIRSLMKRPTFTLISVLTLALCIGATVAIFSVVDAVLLRSLSYKDPERIVVVRQHMPKMNHYGGGISAPDISEYIARNRSLSETAAYRILSMNITGAGDATILNTARMSPGFFPLMGLSPRFGRIFSNNEDQIGKSNVAILSEDLWRKRFSSDEQVIGRQIKLNEQNYTIIGVLPSRMRLPSSDGMNSDPIEIFIPLALTDQEKMSGNRDPMFNLIGRLKSGVTIDQAKADMATVSSQIEKSFPNIFKGSLRIVGTAESLMQQLTGNVRQVIWLLFGAVGVVLLIAIVNIANLQLVRAIERRKEFAIKGALGAGGGRIAWQVISESILLSLIGGGLGILFAKLAMDLIIRFGPDNIHRLTETGLNIRSFGFSLLVVLVTGVLFSLAPMFQSFRVDVTTALSESGRNSSTGGQDGARIRKGLVILETALAIVLLVGAGLLINSFIRLLNVPPGFNPVGVATIRTTLPNERFPNPEQAKNTYRRLLEQARVLPNIQSVAITSSLPLEDNWEIGLRIEGRNDSEINLSYGSVISNDYFSTMGIAMRGGRVFNDNDRVDTTPVIVVNETLARRFWPGENAISKRVRWGGWNPEGWLTVVGVVADVRFSSLEDNPPPTVYIPIFQFSRHRRNSVLIARTSGDPSQLVGALQQVIKSIDTDLPVYDGQIMEQVIANSVTQRRLVMFLTSIFAATALILATIGIYGVMSYTVSQRIREIGIRTAFGANRWHILKLFVGGGMLHVIAGGGIGLIAALYLCRFVEGLLFGLSVTDPLTYVLSFAVLLLTSLIACWFPAMRAAKVDPMVALRCE